MAVVVTKYQDTVADAATGRPIANAIINVYDYPSGAVSTRYNEAGTLVVTDPIVTDSNGYFSFHVVPGHYSIAIAGQFSRQLTDLLVGPSPPGLPGQGFSWSGQWTSITVYPAYSVVYRSGNSYVAVQQSLGVDPVNDTTQTYWQLFAQGGGAGLVEASSQAEQDALVTAGYKMIVRLDQIGTVTPTIPAAPVLSATAGSAQNTITWGAVSGATSYNLYWTSDGTTPTLASTKIAGVTSAYVHSPLTNGTAYKYAVTAVNSAGESAVSNVVSATPSATTYAVTLTQPAHGTLSASASTVAAGGSVTITYTPSIDYHITGGTATNGTVSGLSGNQFTVSNITANVTIGANVAINVYTLTGSAGANGTMTNPGASSINYGGTLTYTITPTTGYHVADVLVDGASVGAVISYTFNNVTANHTISVSFAADVVGNQLPTAPTGLAASGYLADGTGFHLFWSAATDPDGTVASYKIYKGGVLAYSGITATDKAITGQTAGSSAAWTVSAVDNSGAEGPQSAGLTVQMIAAAPTANTVTAGDGQLTVNWTDVTGETSYNVYYSTSPALTGTTYDGTTAYPTPNATAGKITGIAANSVSQVITGLTNGTAYYARVSAVNSSGESALSTAVSGTPAGAVALFGNAGFESALASGAQYGNWWAVTAPGATGVDGFAGAAVAEQVPVGSTGLDGSLVGHLKAVGGDNTDMTGGTGGPTPSTANLYQQFAYADINNLTGPISFKVRPASMQGKAGIKVKLFNVSGTDITVTTNDKNVAKFWTYGGDTWGSAATQVAGTFAVNTVATYSLDLKAIINANGATGIDHVQIYPQAYENSGLGVGGGATGCEFYIDSFTGSTVATVAPTTPVITVTEGSLQKNTIDLSTGGTVASSYDLHWGTTAGVRNNVIPSVTLPYTHVGLTDGTTYYYSLVATNPVGSTESAEVGQATATFVANFDAGLAPYTASTAFPGATVASGHLVLVQNGTKGESVYKSISPSANDFEVDGQVEFDAWGTANSLYAYLTTNAGAGDASVANGYVMLIQSPSNTVRIRKVVNGAATDLVSNPFNAPVGSWKNWKFVKSGSTLTVYYDGAVAATVTDTTYTGGFVEQILYAASSTPTNIDNVYLYKR
jgi:hypothetical protein